MAYDDYLQPDGQEESPAWNIAKPLIGMAAFGLLTYPKFVEGVFKGLGVGAREIFSWTKGTAVGGAKAAGKASTGIFRKAYANRQGFMGAAKSFGRSAKVAAGKAYRGGLRGTEFLTENIKPIGTGIVAGSALWGAVRGMWQPVTGGPENVTAYDNSTGMAPDNLGATGDLTLALHQRRRR